MKKVLFMGDSITDFGRHVAIIDAYLILNNQYGKYLIDNIGLSSENVCGLTEVEHPFPRPNINDRVDAIFKTFTPDTVIVMYGINDGIYMPLNEDRERSYREGLTKLLNTLKSRRVKVLLCTPTYFDHKSVKSPMLTLEDYSVGKTGMYCDYDEVMERYSDIIKTEFADKVDKVIDMHSAMKNYIIAKHNANPIYSSGDGIHPNPEVSYVMAQCILSEGLSISDNIIDLRMDKSFIKILKYVFHRDDLVHKYYKETVGHCSPYKDKYLPMDKLKNAVDKINKKISVMADINISDKLMKWTKCPMDSFHFHGYSAVVVRPTHLNNKGEWIIRTEFFGAFPAADKAALELGYHVAFINMPNMYGCAVAISELKEFYDYCKAKYTLSKKVLLLGISRGALAAVNFADSYPKLVGGLIIDGGVIDIRSWPLGESSSIGSPIDAKRVKAAYGKESFGNEYATDLHNKLTRLARNNIKVYLNAGDSDNVVPYTENGLLIKEAYGANNPNYKEKINFGLGHHPHSNYDYRDIIEWFKTE